MPWIKTSRRASVTGPIPNRTTAHSRGSARSSALARLALAILLGSAPARAASDDPFEPPPRKLDFLHMRFEVTLTEDDMQARRMHGVVTYWIRPKFEGSLNPGSESVTRIELDAVDLDIESVEQAGPRALPEWPIPQPPPIEWPGSEAEPAARGLVFRPAEYRADGNRLAIELDRPCRPEQGVWVRIRYLAENPRTGLHFVRPDADHPERPTIVYTNAEPIQARYWLPCRDWPDARWASDVLLTVPAGYTGISVGEPVGDPVASPASDDPRAAATRTFHWHQSYPIDPHLLGFAVGKFIELRFPPARALSPENTNATKQPDVFAYVQPGAVEARDPVANARVDGFALGPQRLEVVVELAVEITLGHGRAGEAREEHEIREQDMVERAVQGLEEGAQVALALRVRQSGRGLVELAVHPGVVVRHQGIAVALVHPPGSRSLSRPSPG